MTEKEMIEEMAKIQCDSCKKYTGESEDCNSAECLFLRKKYANELYEQGYRKIPDGSVVLTREEYEKIKSLYDCGSGYMTSSIGDLPLTVEGLRTAVDEITRLNRVEAELQELNVKYYNEAKDLRRELKQARKETAKEFASKVKECKEIKELVELGYIVSYVDLCKEIDELAKKYGVEE